MAGLVCKVCMAGLVSSVCMSVHRLNRGERSVYDRVS